MDLHSSGIALTDSVATLPLHKTTDGLKHTRRQQKSQMNSWQGSVIKVKDGYFNKSKV